MADNEHLARGLYEAWNAREYDRLAESMASDGTITVVGSGDIFRGPGGAAQYHRMWANAFPDGVITIDGVISAGEHVVVEFTGRGTHTGTLRTSAASVPATGRSVTLQLCDVLVFSNGRITSQRSYFDGASLMAQLGLLAERPASAQT